MEKVKIIYEDEGMLVVDKPAGMVTTTESQKSNPSVGGLKVESLEGWVEENRPNNLPRKGIVHRLDKGTSGLVVVAKNEDRLAELKKQFKQRKVKKHYWAMAGGDLPAVGSINMPIARSKYSFGRFRVDEDGKLAETEFQIKAKYVIEGKVYSLIDINLKTGRTHQIRVHLSYLGWPLLGDAVYGGRVVDMLKRPFLHAYEMEIEGRKFESPLAKDLKRVMEVYEKK